MFHFNETIAITKISHKHLGSLMHFAHLKTSWCITITYFDLFKNSDANYLITIFMLNLSDPTSIYSITKIKVVFTHQWNTNNQIKFAEKYYFNHTLTS